jgi:membrane associated rhomboid family serine protease
MGIYDREYYRHDGPSFLGTITNTGQVCRWLIGINVGVFILQIVLRDYGFTQALLLDTEGVAHGEVWRLLTYAFLHSPNDIWHIVWNMLFLWWFGTDVEDLYGPREFLAFYLTAAVVGALAFLAGDALGDGGRFCLGASGAVMAVVVLCAVHYPRRTILLFFILPLPLWLFAVIYVAKDALTLLSRVPSSTAVAVHLGGAAFAFVYYKRQWRLTSVIPWVRSWLRQRNRPNLRVYHEEPQRPVPVAAPPSAPTAMPTTGPAGDVDEHLEAKLDAVLEKVARYGQSSLTESERQVLLRASEVYKKRRS